VPALVRHGYIRTVRTGSALSTETSKNQCAVRWQITKASITSALVKRSRARHIRKVEFIALTPVAPKHDPAKPGRKRSCSNNKLKRNTENQPKTISLWTFHLPK